ncbi:hypothetical protein BDV39DRAFT_182373, partial [Aspergillus sergii]
MNKKAIAADKVTAGLYLQSFQTSSFQYHSLLGFGEYAVRTSDSVAPVSEDWLVITTGQTGMHPLTREMSPEIEEEIAQAFSNVNNLVLHTLKQTGHS